MSTMNETLETQSCPFCAEKAMEILRLNDEINAFILEKSALSKMLASAKQELYDSQQKALQLDEQEIKLQQDRQRMNDEFAQKHRHLIEQNRKLVRECIQSASAAPRIEQPPVAASRNPLRIFSRPASAEPPRSEPPFVPETDIRRYLAQLGQLKADLIVILSVRDTPGLALDEALAQEIMGLGFKISLHGKHWHSYVAILDGGSVRHEALEGKKAASVSLEIGDLPVEVVSQAFKSGDMASIQVGGIDYAVNGRGLNIVVVRKSAGRVIDSVCFDTHTPEFTCTR